MKNIIYLMCTFFAFVACNQPQGPVYENNVWYRIESNCIHTINDIAFSLEQTVWAVGDSGTILMSNDNGKTWKQQISPTFDDITDITFPDSSVAYICTENVVFKTSDAGTNWEKVYDASSFSLPAPYTSDVMFMNCDTGLFVGGPAWSSHVLFKTTDGGENWTYLHLNAIYTTPGLYDISSVDNYIWICGGQGWVVTSNNAGATWNNSSNGTMPANFDKIQFISKDVGWMAGIKEEENTFYKSTNGGIDWNQVSNDTDLNGVGICSFHFVDNNNGWICTYPSNKLIETNNGGDTWNGYDDNTYRIKAINSSEKGTCIAVGDSGLVLRYQYEQ